METNLSLVSVLESIYLFEFTSTGFILIVLWYVCALCVCLCVCLYSSTVTASSNCKISKTYLRGTDQRSCVVNIYLGASANFLYLHIWKCHILPPKTKAPHILERKRYDIVTASEKMIYIDIGYKSDTNQNLQVTKRY